MRNARIRSWWIVPLALAATSTVVRAEDDEEGVNGISDADLKEGLVLHLPLDGYAKDKSKNKLNGVIHGATMTDGHSGPGSLALDFDGVDDYVDLAAALSTVNALSQGSIALWFRVDQAPDQFPNRALGIPQTQQITYPVLYLGKIDPVTGNNSLMVHPIHPNARPTVWYTIVRNSINQTVPPYFCFDSCYFPPPRTNTATLCDGPGWDLLTAGEWYHYAVTVDVTGNKGYLNGEILPERRFNPNRERAPWTLVPPGAGPPSEATDVEFFDDVLGATMFHLGAGAWAYSTVEKFVDGAIDEVRIYDRVLSAEEVEALYLSDDYHDDLDLPDPPCGEDEEDHANGHGHAYGQDPEHGGNAYGHDDDPSVSEWLGL